MGKNKKTRHVVNSNRFDDVNQEAPVEFLTSDDFQVVYLKKKYNKRPSGDSESSSLPRFRSNSAMFSNDIATEYTEDQGCHSSFWNNRHGICVSNDLNIDYSKPNDLHVNGKDMNNKTCVDSKIPENTNILNDLFLSKPADGCANLESEILSDSQCSEDGKINYSEHSGQTVKQSAKPVDCFQKGNFKSLNNNSHKVEVHEIGDVVNNKIYHDSLFDSHCIDEVNNLGTKNLFIDTKENTVRPAYDDNSLFVSDRKDKKSRKKNKTKVANSSSTVPNSTHETVVTDVLSSGISSKDTNKSEEAYEKPKKELENRKRPNKTQLAAIHEALRKAKEFEDKQKKEEETRLKLAEESEKLRLEKLKMEQEKKEKKKLKEKEKREKMKAEGRLLSKSQKQARARLQATLEAFRQQGVQVPELGSKKSHAPSLGDLKANSRSRLNSCHSESNLESKSQRFKSESLSSQGSTGFSDLPSSFDSRESFDMSSLVSSARTTESEVDHFSLSENSDADENADAKSNCRVNKNLSENKIDKAISSTEITKSDDNLRSPVICVLGHVDTGKTKILDYVRKTNVQSGEAGGITQQIGATMIPREALKEKCKMVQDFSNLDIIVPGLLVIDTPGHESFNNLRIRGTSICDIAVLVVDIMHGLEAQTIESINILKDSKIPFIVALNKVDRIYGWKSGKAEDIVSVVNNQSHTTSMEFKERCNNIVLQFAHQCLNAALFYENNDPRTYISMVPTSAITGDGMGNILSLITQLTQSMMHKKLVFSEDLEATVLEVKAIPGLGTTIDVILVNGRLNEGDTIVLAGQEGPIVTQIRSLLMPHSLKELRVKSPYVEYKTVAGSQGVKISGKDLDKTVAGMPVLVAKNHNEVESLKVEMLNLRQSSIYIKTSDRGVTVQASTLGSLEALLGYLSTCNIPYVGIKVGPVVKKDVMKASTMLEHDIQYAAILAFDVKIEKDAQELADHLGVKIFPANIIYHLFDQYVLYRDDILKKREEVKHLAVFPCLLSLAQDPVTINNTMKIRVKVVAGILRLNTPICVPSKGCLDLGSVSSIETNENVSCAKAGEIVNVTLEQPIGAPQKSFGVDFDEDDYLASRLTRRAIEICKQHYMDEVDWDLIAELKKIQPV